MQIKIYAIPVMGGEKLMEEMNTFLRTKKILQVEKQFYSTAQTAAWTFCISYLEDSTAVNNEKVKIDYRQVLDAASFERFSKMREIRKRLATEESLPAYPKLCVVFVRALRTKDKKPSMTARPIIRANQTSVKSIFP
jgi:hypothetical protein